MNKHKTMVIEPSNKLKEEPRPDHANLIKKMEEGEEQAQLLKV